VGARAKQGSAAPEHRAAVAVAVRLDLAPCQDKGVSGLALQVIDRQVVKPGRIRGRVASGQDVDGLAMRTFKILEEAGGRIRIREARADRRADSG
jgi:hypothetical protein